MLLTKLSDIGDRDTKILLWSDNDLDGMIGGWIVKRCYPLSDWYHTRKNILQELYDSGDIFNYDKLVLVDIGIADKELFYLMLEIFDNNIIIIDHHETMKQRLLDWNIEQQFNIDLSKSATFGVFDLWIRNNESCDAETYNRLRSLVQSVNVYDMWKEYDKGFVDAKLLNRLLYYLGEDLFIERVYRHIYMYEDLVPENESKGFLRAMQLDNKYVQDKVNEAYLSGNEAIVFAEKLQSEIGNELLKKYSKLDVAMIINLGKDSISIRSKKNKALEKINFLGLKGGGHQNASGAKLNMKFSIMKQLLDK